MPGTKGVTISGNAATDARNIQTYLEGLDKNAKLRSKIDGNGNRIIYAQTKSSGLFEQLSGSAKQKKAAAHREIGNLVDQIKAKNLTKTYGSMDQQEATRDANDARAILQRSPGQSPRACNAKAAVMLLNGSSDRLDFRARDKEGFQVSKLGDVSAAYTTASAQLKAGNKDAAIKTLSDAIVTAMKNNLTDSEKEALVFSPGMAVRREIDAMLAQELGAAYDQLLPHAGSTGRRDFLAEVVVSAFSQVLDDKQVNKDTITIGGKDYVCDTSVGAKKDGVIGEGGFGKVYIYKHTASDGTVEQIAVKLSEPFKGDDLDGKFINMGKEALMHKAALAGGGGDNIVGLKGAFRTPDGRIGLAMEYCPNGNVEKALVQLHQAELAGTISPTAASAVRLTLLQDIAKGVAQMEKNGMLHGDLKPQNVMISSDGTAKVGDLGTAQQASDFVLQDSSVLANPTWVAPEVLKGQDTIKDIEKGTEGGLKGLAKKARKAVAESLDKSASKLTRGQQAIAHAMFGGHAARDAAKVSVGSKIDSWGLGAIGLNLFTGRTTLGETPPPNKVYTTEVIKATKDFASNVNNRAIAPKGTPGSFVDSRGQGAEEDLINALLHPDKDKRPTATQILTHDAFQGPGVGSQQARDLIKAMMKDPPDTDAMTRASKAMAPPPLE